MARRTQTRRTHRSGFTLLEMMLVVVIIGVLATVAVVALGGQGEKAKITATKSSMTTIDRMIQTYHLDHSSYPATLQTLVPKYIPKIFKDGWKRDFEYFPSASVGGASRPYTFFSKGADGQIGGGDDLDVWTMDDEPVNQ